MAVEANCGWIFWPHFFAATCFFLLGLGENYLDSRPHLETEMWDLKPGISTQEVLFRKGKPNQKGNKLFKTGEPNKKEKDFWIYIDDNLMYFINIENGCVTSVAVHTKTGDLPTIQGISSYSSQEDI